MCVFQASIAGTCHCAECVRIRSHALLGLVVRHLLLRRPQGPRRGRAARPAHGRRRRGPEALSHRGGE